MDVTTPAGTGDEAAAFTYQETGPIINSFSPLDGPSEGGTLVTILGSGFTGAELVVFENYYAPEPAIFTVVSDTEITVVAPPNYGPGYGPDEGPILVETPSGTAVSPYPFIYDNS